MPIESHAIHCYHQFICDYAAGNQSNNAFSVNIVSSLSQRNFRFQAHHFQVELNEMKFSGNS